MGFIKGGLFVIVAVLLFAAFIAGSLFLTFGLSLNYDAVSPKLTEVAGGLAGQIGLQEIVEEMLPAMQIYCGQGNAEYVFSEQGYTFSVPCESVPLGADAVIGELISSFVDDTYYREYDCDFFECLSNGSFSFLISEDAHDYWFSKFYLMIGVVLLLGALMFLLAEKKSNMFVVAGALLIVASIVAVKMDYVVGLIVKTILNNSSVAGLVDTSSVTELMSLFFAKSYTVFLIFFIIGIVTLLFGIVLKFFQIGFWISEFVSKFRKESADAKTSSKQSAVIPKVSKPAGAANKSVSKSKTTKKK